MYCFICKCVHGVDMSDHTSVNTLFQQLMPPGWNLSVDGNTGGAPASLGTPGPSGPSKILQPLLRRLDAKLTSSDTSVLRSVPKGVTGQLAKKSPPDGDGGSSNHQIKTIAKSDVKQFKLIKSKSKPLSKRQQIFERDEFMAVRCPNDAEFWLARLLQNVNKRLGRRRQPIRVQWLRKEDNFKNAFETECLGTLYLESILTNVEVVRIDRDRYRLAKGERGRVEHILKRAVVGVACTDDEDIAEGIEVAKLGTSEEVGLTEAYWKVKDSVIFGSRDKSCDKPFNSLLDDDVLVLSGFLNPERSAIRRKAQEMGARYRSEWDDGATHLVCAMLDTPKYALVHSEGGRIMTRNWIDDCYRERKLLPWRRYKLGDTSRPLTDSECSESEDETDTNVLDLSTTSLSQISPIQDTNKCTCIMCN